MALDTAKRKQVIYFTGTEIENTVAKGWQTLFVVGIRPVDEIAKLAVEQASQGKGFCISHELNHFKGF